MRSSKSLRAYRGLYSKNKTENWNPHPYAECGIGNDHGRALYRLRAARMGVGSFCAPNEKSVCREK